MSDDLISQAQYARRVKISAQLLAHHIRVGNVPTHGENRKVSISEADAALRDVLKRGEIPAGVTDKRTPPAPVAKGQMTLHEARAERARHDAARSKLAREKEEIELSLLKRDVVLIGDVEREWVEALSILRGRLIAIPAKVAGRVGSNSTPTALQALIDAEIRQALEELNGGGTAA